MFLDEARLMALLHHRHITEVYDIGAEDGEYFFALEHVDGCDLRDLRDGRSGQPLPLAAALTVVVAVADGLEHAHGQRGEDGSLLGVVHRDVTPSNVLCGRGGEVKLADFGVAKWTAQRSRTEQGTIKGKFAYMSPEQCRAEPLDRRSDVFALGVILHELTTGSKPFAGESEFEVLTAIVAGRSIPPSRTRPGYPPALEVVVARALSTDRAGRFATAGELRDALIETGAALGLTLGPAAVADMVQSRVAEMERSRTEEPRPAPLDRGRTATDRAAAPRPSPGPDPTAVATLRPSPGPDPAAEPTTRHPIARAAAALALVALVGFAIGVRRQPPPSEPPFARQLPTASAITPPTGRTLAAGTGERAVEAAPSTGTVRPAPPPAAPPSRAIASGVVEPSKPPSLGPPAIAKQGGALDRVAKQGGATDRPKSVGTRLPSKKLGNRLARPAKPAAPALQIWDPDSAILP